jgi:hypothetical protein
MTAEYLPVVFSDIICGRGKPGTSRLACITGQRSQVIEARCLNETNFCTKNSLFSSGVALHSSTVPFSNSVRQCQKSYVTGCRQSREYPSWMTHVYASLLLHAGPSSLVGTRPVCRAHRPRRRQRQPRAHHQLIHAIRQTNLTILLVLQMSLRLIPANLAYTRRSHHEISSWHLYPSASRSLSANQPWRSTRSRKKRRVAQMNMNPLLYFSKKREK